MPNGGLPGLALEGFVAASHARDSGLIGTYPRQTGYRGYYGLKY